MSFSNPLGAWFSVSQVNQFKVIKMGVCARGDMAGVPFYAWKGWNFVTLILIIVGFSIFFYRLEKVIIKCKVDRKNLLDTNTCNRILLSYFRPDCLVLQKITSDVMNNRIRKIHQEWSENDPWTSKLRIGSSERSKFEQVNLLRLNIYVGGYTIRGILTHVSYGQRPFPWSYPIPVVERVQWKVHA